MANGYLGHGYMEDLKAAFPSLEKSSYLPNSARWSGGSFWMRRKPSTLVGSIRQPEHPDKLKRPRTGRLVKVQIHKRAEHKLRA